MTDDPYRARARAWLAEHAPPVVERARRAADHAAHLDVGRDWQRAKAEAGYGAITLPAALGGGGGTELEKIVFSEEEGAYDLPTAYFSISLGMPIPMIARHASAAQAQALVPPAIRGETIWCQLFSEPAAGSDLAALRTVARREGDMWRLTGQKLWTSWAHVADYAIVVARSDSGVPKHAGLTFFFLDMRSPGITVRPVALLTGQSDVNEVYLDEVAVPDAQRLGAVGAGFGLVVETLMMERYAVTDDAGYGPPLAQVIQAVREAEQRCGTIDGEGRAAIAEVYAEQLGLRMIHQQALAALAAGREPGPEGSIRKLRVAATRQRLSRLAMDRAGPAGLALAPDATIRSSFALSWLDAPTLRIAGGTDEILRNTIAERILGLPQDYRPDKALPFNARTAGRG